MYTLGSINYPGTRSPVIPLLLLFGASFKQNGSQNESHPDVYTRYLLILVSKMPNKCVSFVIFISCF